MTRLPLSLDRVDVWIVFIDEIGEDLLDDYRRLLSPDECERERGFRFARDRRMHVVARAALRSVLSRYGDIEPDEWRFSANEYGRPAIVSSQIADAPISFNLSHTAGMIGLAVRERLAVGIDVETVHNRRAAVDIADQVLAVEEIKALKKVPRLSRQDRFLEYWTLKESYIKARGEGLAVPLELFSFNLGVRSRIFLSIAPALKDTPARWRLWQLRPSAEHVMAVCAERVPTCEMLTIRRFVPLRVEEPLACAPYRDSIVVSQH
jgi:4'-phosphopantetheinyl transferase